MRYITYITTECRQSADKHDVTEIINKLVNVIEEEQNIQLFDMFLPDPFLKKDLGNGFRLICARQVAGEFIFIVFIKCISPADPEYEDFFNNPGVFAELIPGETELTSSTEQRDLPVALPEPNDDEGQYLFDYVESFDPNMIIYESDDWVKIMNTPDYAAEVTKFYNLLNELKDDFEKDQNTTINNDDGTVSILYRYFPDQNRMFLVAPFLVNDMEQMDGYKKTYLEILSDSAEDDHYNQDMLLKKCGRLYQSLVLADNTVWESIQNNEEASVAFYPEEALIRESVIQKHQDDSIFPLFISGRNVRGNSTLFQYLFAEQLCRYFKKSPQERTECSPVYLTYNEKLLDNARNVVKDVVMCNARLAIDYIDLDSPENAEVFDDCFLNFHRFILKILPEDKKSIFIRANRVDYPEFQQLWDDYSREVPPEETEIINPEIAWYVIRTYIKGMCYHTDTDFDTNSYRLLPETQQAVSPDTFDRIYNHVWKAWYRDICAEKSLWDEQDLILTILSSSNIDLSQYPAVFFDQAQDLTKAELHLIYRLSLYTKLTLTREQVRMVPFAFCGDPCLTTNPVGFNQDMVQAGFTEKIVCGLDKNAGAGLSLNYHEYADKYRSTKVFADIAKQQRDIFLNGAKGHADCRILLSFLFTETKTKTTLEILNDLNFAEVFTGLLQSISQLTGIEDIKSIYGRIKAVRENGLKPVDDKLLAGIALMAGEHQEAVSIYDRMDKPPMHQKEYLIAKARLSTYPENVEWLYKAGLFEEVVEQWRGTKKAGLDHQTAGLIVKILLKLNKHPEALYLLKKYPDEKIMEEILAGAMNNGNMILVDDIAKNMVKYMVRQSKWKKAVDIIRNEGLEEKSRDTLIKLFTHYIATSDRLFNDEPTDDEKNVGNFFREMYIDNTDSVTLPLKAVGAAIEKAGYIGDILGFYESIWDRSNGDYSFSEKQYAKERWVKCKLKYAENLSENGYARDAAKHERQAEEIIRANSFDRDAIDEYPVINFEDKDIIITKLSAAAEAARIKAQQAMMQSDVQTDPMQPDVPPPADISAAAAAPVPGTQPAAPGRPPEQLSVPEPTAPATPPPAHHAPAPASAAQQTGAGPASGYGDGGVLHPKTVEGIKMMASLYPNLENVNKLSTLHWKTMEGMLALYMAGWSLKEVEESYDIQEAVISELININEKSGAAIKPDGSKPQPALHPKTLEGIKMMASLYSSLENITKLAGIKPQTLEGMVFLNRLGWNPEDIENSYSISKGVIEELIRINQQAGAGG